MTFWRKFISTKKGCKILTKKAKEQFFKSVFSNIWQVMSNSGMIFWDHTSINGKDKIIDNEAKLVELFNTFL